MKLFHMTIFYGTFQFNFFYDLDELLPETTTNNVEKLYET